MIFRWTALLIALALALAACGGGRDRTKAQVRLVNASGGYAALDFSVNGSVVQGGVSYANVASYVEVDPGNDDSIISSTGSPTALLSFTPALSKDHYYSVVAYGNAGALSQQLIDENVNAPDNGKALLTVLNGAPDAGALDVYLTGSSDSLASAVPVQSAAAFGSPYSALTVTAATYRLRVAASSSKTDVRLDLPTLTLGNQSVATLVLTPGSGGVLVNAVLIVQQGGVARLDGMQARVRVAAGVADGASVGASVGGTTLTNAVGSPSVGAYALVPAGSQAVAITVNGTALAATSTTLTAGGDYTLLVSGPSAAPVANWIADDNHPPSDTTQARLRLVNGVSGLANPLSMTADLLPVADSVAAGSASGYTLVATTITGQLSVTTAGQATPVFSAGTQTLAAGGVYSFFVLGGSNAVTGVLRKDR